jgi:tetratricopeptide (TPR) repeat protein
MPMFTGRERELAALTSALAQPTAPGGTAVIVGMGGLGKTWLAVQWAYENCQRFPDGQLFVDLRGFHQSGRPVSPADALRGFLDALGVAPGSIPIDAEARQGLFRTLMSGRRMLVVLDNARDTEQVEGLLPGSDSCAVLVTGRGRLTGLVGRHGAYAVPLEVVDDADARLLMKRRFGGDDLGLTDADTDQVVAACGGLPLALGIAAARAVLLPRPVVSTVVAELADASSRLDAFDDDHSYGGLRAVLSWSVAALDSASARTFLLLGLLGGPDLGLPAIAALVGVPAERAAGTVRVLEQHSLLTQRSVGRWALHDLLRLYASERAERDLSGDERRSAVSRLVDHYLHTARAADALLEPAREPVPVEPAAAAAAPRTFDDAATAWRWFEAENTCLTEVRHHAANLGRHAAVWQLALVTDTLHRRKGQLRHRSANWCDALDAAVRAGDLAAQAMAHRFLGTVRLALGQRSEAFEELDLALRQAEQVGDRLAYAHTLKALSTAHGQAGRIEVAYDLSVKALAQYRPTGKRHLAHAMNGVGWYATFLGRYEEARRLLEEALRLARADSDSATEANVLDSLGHLFSRTGEHRCAVEYYQRAAALADHLGHAFIAVETRERLGDSYAAMNSDKEAHRHWQAALTMYRDQHRTLDFDRVQSRIRNVCRSVDPGH